MLSLTAGTVEAPAVPSSPTSGRDGGIVQLCDDCAWEACWLANACARRTPGVIDPEPSVPDLAPPARPAASSVPPAGCEPSETPAGLPFPCDLDRGGDHAALAWSLFAYLITPAAVGAAVDGRTAPTGARC